MFFFHSFHKEATRTNGKRIRILPVHELKGNDVSRHTPYAYTKYPVCSFDPELGETVPQCQVSVYDIPPLCSNYPYHYHENSTEIFYILEGRGVLETPTGNHPVTAGDFIVMPPGKRLPIFSATPRSRLRFAISILIPWPARTRSIIRARKKWELSTTTAAPMNFFAMANP